jgi:hypothetical protein
MDTTSLSSDGAQAFPNSQDDAHKLVLLPLEKHVRCIETKYCAPCNRRADREGAATGAEEPSDYKSTIANILADPWWPFIAPLVDPLLPIFPPPLPPAFKSNAPPHVVPQNESNKALIPSLFLKPDPMGLPPVDADPRQLFARLSPANVISLVTALLCERRVMVVCSDVSALSDIMVTAISLLHPFKWWGAFIPVCPLEFPLEDILENPSPVFVGTHPDLVRRARGRMASNYVTSTANSREEIRTWQSDSDSSVSSDHAFDQSTEGDDRLSIQSDDCTDDTCNVSGDLGSGSFTKSTLFQSVCNAPRTHGRPCNDLIAEKRKEFATNPDRFWKKYYSSFLSIPEELQEKEKSVGKPCFTRKGVSSEKRWGLLPNTWDWDDYAMATTRTSNLGSRLALGRETRSASDGGSVASKRYDAEGSGSLVIVDVDADAVNMQNLPSSYYLPLRLSMRLWKSILLYANLHVWCHPRSVTDQNAIPSPLPLFPRDTSHNEVAAADAIAKTLTRRANLRGWSHSACVPEPFDLPHDPSKSHSSNSTVRGPVESDTSPVHASNGSACVTNTCKRQLLYGDSLFAPVLGVKSSFESSALADDSQSRMPAAPDGNPTSTPKRPKPAYLRRGTSAPAVSLRILNCVQSDDEDEDDENEELGTDIAGTSTERAITTDCMDLDVAAKPREDTAANSNRYSIDDSDVMPIPVTLPWSLWRQRLIRSANVRAGGQPTISTGGNFDTHHPTVYVFEPPLHFTRLRLQFLKVMVSMFKAYRLYFRGVRRVLPQKFLKDVAIAAANDPFTLRGSHWRHHHDYQHRHHAAAGLPGNMPGFPKMPPRSISSAAQRRPSTSSSIALSVASLSLDMLGDLDPASLSAFAGVLDTEEEEAAANFIEFRPLTNADLSAHPLMNDTKAVSDNDPIPIDSDDLQSEIEIEQGKQNIVSSLASEPSARSMEPRRFRTRHWGSESTTYASSKPRAQLHSIRIPWGASALESSTSPIETPNPPNGPSPAGNNSDIAAMSLPFTSGPVQFRMPQASMTMDPVAAVMRERVTHAMGNLANSSLGLAALPFTGLLAPRNRSSVAFLRAIPLADGSAIVVQGSAAGPTHSTASFANKPLNQRDNDSAPRRRTVSLPALEEIPAAVVANLPEPRSTDPAGNEHPACCGTNTETEASCTRLPLTKPELSQSAEPGDTGKTADANLGSLDIFQLPAFHDAFNADAFLAESVSPDVETLVRWIVQNGQLFPQFVLQKLVQDKQRNDAEALAKRGGPHWRVAQEGAVESTALEPPTDSDNTLEPDIFDRQCYRRMFLRFEQHLRLGDKPHSGQLYKADRGRFDRQWKRRYVELVGDEVFYFSHAEELENVNRALRDAYIARARLEPIAKLSTGAVSSGMNDAVTVAGMGGIDFESPQEKIKNEYERLRQQITLLEKENARLRTRYTRGTFALIPGRTEIVIPSTRNAAFPSEFVFQLVNPSLQDMKTWSKRRLTFLGLDATPTRQSAHERPRSSPRAEVPPDQNLGREPWDLSSDPDGNEFVRTRSSRNHMDNSFRACHPTENSESCADVDDSALIHAARAVRISRGGAGSDILTFAADSSTERYEWISYLKARLQLGDHVTSLSSLYLHPAADAEF